MSILRICIGVLLNLLIFDVSTAADQQMCIIIGSTVQLTCAKEAHSTQWIKDRFTISDNDNINKDVKDPHRFRILFQNISNEFTLQIHSTTMSDQGQYICDGLGRHTYIPFTKITYLCVIKIFVWPSTVVAEGTDVNISCFHECPQECNNISLFKDGIQFSRSKLIQLQNISRNSSGNYICSLDSDRTFTSNKTITVQYPPRIQLIFNNATSLLTCDVTGFPEPNVNLEHFSSNGQLVRVISATRKGIFLTTYEDSGIYRCSAQNGVMSSTGLLNFSEIIFIELEGPPIFAPNNSNTFYGQLNRNITIAINIYCRTSCNDIYWVTSIDNSSAQQKTMSQYREDVFFMKFHNVSVEVNGSITSLVLTHLTDEDFGTYTVVAENSVNTSYFSVYLKANAADTQIRAIEWYILTFVVTTAGMFASCCFCLYVQEHRRFHRTRNKTDVLQTTIGHRGRSNRRNIVFGIEASEQGLFDC